MRTLIPSALLLSALLSACGGGPTPPQPPSGGNPLPTPPAVTFIPEAGAAVGTGDGTKLGTVYVSPSVQEVEVMRLVNEVRTKGTLNGTDAIAGSCVEGTFQPNTLRALTYNGLFAYAARKHAIYMSEVGYEVHAETQTASSFFYGATIQDRVARAYREQGGLSQAPGAGEIVVTGRTRATPEAAMRAWMLSPGHCRSIMLPEYRMMSSGHYEGAENTQANRWGHSWSVVFGY